MVKQGDYAVLLRIEASSDGDARMRAAILEAHASGLDIGALGVLEVRQADVNWLLLEACEACGSVTCQGSSACQQAPVVEALPDQWRRDGERVRVLAESEIPTRRIGQIGPDIPDARRP